MASSIQEFKSQAQSWSDITATVEKFAAAETIPSEALQKLTVCLDELYSNSVKYGGVSEASLSITKFMDRIEVGYADDAAAFDPIAWSYANSPGPDTPPDQIGGAGIHLVLGLCEEIAYARAGGRNALQFSLPI